MDFFEVLHTQRSIRRFKPDPMPDEAIWMMIDAAIRAPSGSNLQPWIWLVVRDEAKRAMIAREVREYARSTDMLEEMSEDMQRTEDPSRKRLLRLAMEFFQDMSGAPVLIIPCLLDIASPVDDSWTLVAGSSIYGAVQNLMLAARAQGLGTVLTTIHPYIEDMLHRELHIPEGAVPVCVVPVGYPDGQRFGPTTRKPAQTVTYWDDWGVRAAR